MCQFVEKHVSILLFRKRRLEAELSNRVWKVNADDIEFKKLKKGTTSRVCITLNSI